MEYFSLILLQPANPCNSIISTVQRRAARRGDKKMSIDIITIKYMGKKESLFRVIDAEGEVLQVLCTKEEAEEWMKSQLA